MESKDFIHNEFDWFNNPLLRTHEFKSLTPCGHYIGTQCLGKGESIFESIGESILPNPPSASASVDSSTITVPHLEEPLESPLTSNHS